MWYVHAMEYYSSLKRERNSETCYNISGISQSQKDKFCMITLLRKVPRLVKFIKTNGRMVVSRD